MACEHCTNSSYLMRKAIRVHQRSSEVIRGHHCTHSTYSPNVSSGGQSSRKYILSSPATLWMLSQLVTSARGSAPWLSCARIDFISSVSPCDGNAEIRRDPNHSMGGNQPSSEAVIGNHRQ